jgi:hypothetical protein
MLKEHMNKTKAVGSKQDPEARVGIFWMHENRLIIDSVPLPDAERYGDCIGYAGSHIDFWTKLQREGAVSPDAEYDEPPRGRVVYDIQTGGFVLYADTCILRRRGMVQTIISKLSLPVESTETKTDAHYRCSQCPGESPDL